jgi:Ni,Fe-hydrogenase III component G
MTPRARTDVVEATASDLRGHVAARLSDGFRTAMVAGHEDTDGFRIVYVLVRASDDRRCEIVLRTPHDRPEIPSLAAVDYAVGRFEREIRDLYGVVPVGHPLPYRLVRHGHWPQGWYHPCGATPTLTPTSTPTSARSRSSRSRGTASTRSRSVPSTPG